MHSVGTAGGDNAVALVAVEDVDVASRSPAGLLISAATQQGVETLARRTRGAGPRAQLPFGDDRTDVAHGKSSMDAHVNVSSPARAR
jgi:hypothetical protein